MRWVWFGVEDVEDKPRLSWGGTASGIAGEVAMGGGEEGAVAGWGGEGWLVVGWPVERLRLRMLEMPREATTGVA